MPGLEELLRGLLPLLEVLPDVLREVGRSRRSRLNCWERESIRTTGSRRSSTFRSQVISYYKRASNSKKSVRCQILNEYVFRAQATNIVAAHIWKVSTVGDGLQDFGLEHGDVDSPRNGLFLTKGIVDAFDRQRVCFLYNLLQNKLFLWVADPLLMDETIAGSSSTFADVHEKPLHCPNGKLPFRRLLSWHARLTLERWDKYDNSPAGRESADDVDRIINEAVFAMVEAGDDASILESRNDASTLGSVDDASTLGSVDDASTLESRNDASTLGSGDHASTLGSGDHASMLDCGDHASMLDSGDHASM